MGGKLAFAVSFISRVAPVPFILSFIHSLVHSATILETLGCAHTFGCLSFFVRFSLSQEFVAKTPVETLGPDHL